MKRIGIISDTHAYWDDKYLHYFEPCDEIWHAGDIGSMEVAERLADFRMFRAVCGNCDGGDLRRMFPEKLRWKCEDADVLMKHIGGYPGNYDQSITFHLRALPYTESEIRQDAQPAAHQPRSSRPSGMAQGQDDSAPDG